MGTSVSTLANQCFLIQICFSMSDFHPEQWNPMWNIGTILTGLVSFMNSEEITTGGMSAEFSTRREFAKNSLKVCMHQDALAKELFQSTLKGIAAERQNHGIDKWPPTRPPPKKPQKPVGVVQKAPRRNKASQPKATECETEQTESKEEPASVATKQPDQPGKNAAKNRKKREKEKRKKLAKTFLNNMREQAPQFIQDVILALEKLEVNVSDYQADHVCWRTESMEEYTDLVTALLAATENTRLLVESEIGGRSIATFELLEPIHCGDGCTITVVEIPAPKDGRPYKRGLEHVEFVIGDGDNGGPLNAGAQRVVLEEFMNNNCGVDWNTKAIDKPLNPDVSLEVKLKDFDACSVKFHLVALSEVIEYEKQQSVAS